MSVPLTKKSNAPISPYAAPHAEVDTNSPFAGYNTEPFYAKNGRIGRVRYMAYGILINLVASAAMFVGGIIVSILSAVFGSESIPMAIAPVLVLVFFLIFQLYGTFVPAKRRLNDLNQSGWVSLLFLFPVINLLFWLYLVFAPGTEGVNDYGAPAEPPSTLMIILAAIMPFIAVAIIGILAAIALPAYQDYALRSQIAQLSVQP